MIENNNTMPQLTLDAQAVQAAETPTLVLGNEPEPEVVEEKKVFLPLAMFSPSW